MELGGDKIEVNKIFSSHNIVYRNLKRDEFLDKVLFSFEKKHITFKKCGLNNQLVYVNILEGEHNSNMKPIEQFAIRDSSGKMIMNNLLVYEIYIPTLLQMMQKNNDLFMPDELIMDSFEISKFHNDSGKPDIDETENISLDDDDEDDSSNCTLTNSFINDNEKDSYSESGYESDDL